MKNEIKKARKFLKDHKGHELFPCDSPFDKTRGICCNDCEVIIDIPQVDFDSDPILSKWHEGIRNRAREASERQMEIRRMVREMLDAHSPEVRFTANWYGD